MKLVLFDLDNTLLSGDSNVLWCEFLTAQCMVDGDAVRARNADLQARYHNGTVGLQEFTDFYLGLLAGQSPRYWEPIRQKFLAQAIIPRIGRDARELANRHLGAGDLVVMITATNRFITELTAASFGIDNLIATDPQVSDGLFTGGSVGVLNMREGKVVRLHQWLTSRGLSLETLDSIAYSDSINDLPLLKAVNCAVAVDPDPHLHAQARQRGWAVVHLNR